ncbi:MAG: phenylalanine--tRNA ligase subunit beta, partial [Erysipelotrichaceae bacterium]|nr:phenylalanine--tRNA ligase subunit beta [Erysipelotrichaceae bacterium]
MRLSYKWLQEFVNLEGYTPESLADKLTTAGLEVEGIERMASGTKLCIGEVLECVDHPDSDHLHVTKTNVGDEVLQIVCGAPNCRAGLKVIVALPGCVLPGGEIKKGMIRGQESNGMLCALYELGVDKKNLTEYQASGIEELPADAPVGETNVLEYLGLDDVILEVGLTPNRADCSAMWNMAKEVGAVIRREVKLPEVEGASKVGKPNTFKVNSTTEKCPYFLGKVVNHVEVGPSPKWMQEYLHAAGVKAINNVVDISNYVMLETGQPLHFYDLAKLPHHEITVVDDVEMKMTALDGIEYQIEKGDLLITTGGEPTGVAGIMGGEESKIDENTKAIFIEAALFNHVSIRNTSRRLNLLTEAATRFSKGLEPLSQIKAVDRSVDLLTKYAGGSDYEENVEYGHNDYKPVVIEETLTHMNSLLGMNFTMDQVVEVLTALDFKPEVNGDTVISHIPSYRTDMERNADVDEEVIRLIGFDALKSTLPTMEATVGRLSPEQVARRDIRHMMTGLGLSEIVTYTLV